MTLGAALEQKDDDELSIVIVEMQDFSLASRMRSLYLGPPEIIEPPRKSRKLFCLS